jgi:hypothetical protein
MQRYAMEQIHILSPSSYTLSSPICLMRVSVLFQNILMEILPMNRVGVSLRPGVLQRCSGHAGFSIERCEKKVLGEMRILVLNRAQHFFILRKRQEKCLEMGIRANVFHSFFLKKRKILTSYRSIPMPWDTILHIFPYRKRRLLQSDISPEYNMS